MENIDIKGYERKEIGKQLSKRLRLEAKVPCVMYGGKEKLHFYIPMAYLKDLVYTPNVYFINLEIGNKTYKTILQDIQFHPVSELVLHIDFLEISDDKEIKMMIPIVFRGESPGIIKGGLLTKSIRKLRVKGLPENIPSKIPVDVSTLELGNTAKIKDIKIENYEILMPKQIPVAQVVVPRALKSKQTAASSEEPVEQSANGNDNDKQK
ncbi:MAG: 50S ribosomal protein L25/general stress protein Ctc [Bacteroidetes bacterium]|nr:50S ribosomal protein L25/general stress protein Ctc [Bacteroidota bacterium]